MSFPRPVRRSGRAARTAIVAATAMVAATAVMSLAQPSHGAASSPDVTAGGASSSRGATVRGASSRAEGTPSPEGARGETPSNYDAATASPTALTAAGARVLRESVGDIRALGSRLGWQGRLSVDPLTGTPDNVARLDGFLTGPSNRPPSQVVLRYLRANLASLGLAPADLSTLRLRRSATDVHGVTHLSYVQSVDGIPVFGRGLRAHVTDDGSLISLQGAPVGGLARLAAGVPGAGLRAAEARRLAARNVRGRLVEASARAHAGAQRTTTWANGDSAALVYFLAPGGLRLGWSTYTRLAVGGAYQHVIDAATGRMLYRHSTINRDRGDALVYDQYPGAARGGTQRVVNLFGAGYLPRRATFLDGSYAITWADVNDNNRLDGNEKTPVPGTASSAQFRLVPFPRASTQCKPSYICTWDPDKPFSWRTNRNQDATQGFYFASRFHDYLKARPIGFTPQMGNFEANGGDPVLLHVLDGANSDGGLPDGNHIDNANMETPPDTVPPSMQMYLNHVPGASADADPYLPASSADAADNVYHEYTHGLSNRLVVDALGNSTLNSLHAGAMGEAWSDFYAMDFLVTKGYLPDTAANGEVLFDKYLTQNQPVTRSEAIDCAPSARARLCVKADGSRGGYTFGDLGNATGGPEVHRDGQIWGQTLWDLRARLGHTVTAAIVTEAMSLSPADPTFLDERDSILQADQAVYGGTHARQIWSVFAGRGMGWFASAIDGADARVKESFQLPPSPVTPRGTISGQVTDDATGVPIAGALVYVGGHSSGYVSNYSAVTDADGRYVIPHVLAGTYPELVAKYPGYDLFAEPVAVRPAGAHVDIRLRRDWAASGGGASIDSFTGVDYTPFGCGPGKAIDLTFGQGWSTNVDAATNVGDEGPSDTATPKYLVVKLPQPIDISAFGVDPTGTCGDGGSSSTGDYRIEVSTDGQSFSPVAEGRFGPADRGHVNVSRPQADLPGVRYVRFWILSSQVSQVNHSGLTCEQGAPFSGCTYMDLTELEVYGRPGAARTTDLQLLSFNDFHGHLDATDTPQPPLPAACGPTPAPGCIPPVGGVEYLSSAVKSLKAKQPDSTLTVAAGDLIGGSTFLSGLFQDQPTIEAMNALGLDVSSVGNHEFDEGTAELLRMVNGGCHPTIGCFKDTHGTADPGDDTDIPYDGADFDYLAANVVKKSDGQPLLPGTSVKVIDGIPVGFIGMTLEATPSLVSPGGVSSVDFLDEVATANAEAARLKARGVETIVVLLHEGGYQTGTYSDCTGISGPIVDIASRLDPEIDMVVSGHTHQPYICNVPDPAGHPRMVTSAASWGQVLTESHLKIDLATRDVVRSQVSAANRLVTRDVAKDATQTKIIEFWKALAAPLAARVVGTLPTDTDITGDSSTCRCEETQMVDLVADAILWGTQAPEDGGAQIAFMNTGGVRASLRYSQISNGEQPGEITYAETYNVAPFNNILVTVDMTGAQIEAVLNQQFQRISARGSRPMLSLGVSDGFTYEWAWEGAAPAANSQPTAATTGGHVVPGSMKLNGVPLEAEKTYRVGTLNFLVEGGDSFTVFKDSGDKVGGDEDLANLADYLTAHQPITGPPDRVNGL